MAGQQDNAATLSIVTLLRKAGDCIRLSEHLDSADGDVVFRHACKLGLKGIVAKRQDRPHRSGRCCEWIKIKNQDAPAATRIMEW